MALGSPAITTPNALALRPVQAAIQAARARIEALEQAITAITAAGGSSSTSTTSAAQLNLLRSQLNALTARVTAIENQFNNQVPGFVAWSGSAQVLRTLVAGTGVEITNPTGAAGNPVFSVTAAGGDSVLYDNEGNAGLASDGGALILASGV
jgi:hypothetical protein